VVRNARSNPDPREPPTARRRTSGPRVQAYEKFGLPLTPISTLLSQPLTTPDYPPPTFVKWSWLAVAIHEEEIEGLPPMPSMHEVQFPWGPLGGGGDGAGGFGGPIAGRARRRACAGWNAEEGATWPQAAGARATRARRKFSAAEQAVRSRVWMMEN